MPATMTRGQIRVSVRRKLGEPQGTEGNWLDEQLNEDIQETLDDIAAFGPIRGSVDVDGDGGAEYDIPAEILQLVLIRVGTADYLPCYVADYIGLPASEKANVVLINETEDTVTLPVDVADDEPITFIGTLHATQLDAADESDDDTVLNLDNRFRSALIRGVMFRAHEGTEDNIAVFERAFKEDMMRFGYQFKKAAKVQYRRVLRQVNDHSRF